MIIGDSELIATNDGEKIILIMTKGEKTVLTAMNLVEFLQFQDMLKIQCNEIAEKWGVTDAA